MILTCFLVISINLYACADGPMRVDLRFRVENRPKTHLPPPRSVFAFRHEVSCVLMAPTQMLG